MYEHCLIMQRTSWTLRRPSSSTTPLNNQISAFRNIISAYKTLKLFRLFLLVPSFLGIFSGFSSNQVCWDYQGFSESFEF